MANNGYPYPWEGNPGYYQEPHLRHQISSISAVSSVDLYQGGGPRDTIVSLQSSENFDTGRVRNLSIGAAGIISATETVRSHSSPKGIPDVLRVGTPLEFPTTRRNFNPFRTPPQAYEPVFTAEESSKKPSAPGSKRSSKRSSSSLLQHGTVPEGEEISMNLLANATLMGYSMNNTSYSAVSEEDPDDTSGNYDISSFLGPPQNEEQLKEVNRKEAAGILTGGLGAGLKPDATISSAYLYANAPQSPVTPSSPLARGMSFRSSAFRSPSVRNRGLARAQTVRELGQKEANKRGEIIEVIVEEDCNVNVVDISSFAGGNAVNVDFESSPKVPRKDTIAPKVEIFYPQANWKPFSMSWPYIISLVIVSVTLAAAQEYVLHHNDGILYKFTSVSLLNSWQYFSFKYLPTLIAVSFGVLWQVTDFEVNRLEAFYQLSKKEGALAAESINVDYITFFNFLRPVRALKYKHYAVAVSSLATLMAVSLVPTLQAASLELQPDHKTREENPGGVKEIHINPIFSRVLSSVLLSIAIMGCILLWQLQRRPSGLVADVKGIAGIAAMANRSHILMDFKNMDTASPKVIHKTLNSHRYSLRNSSLAPEEKVPLTQEERDKYDQQNFRENPHPLMLRLSAGVPFIIGMILFAIIVPIILFSPRANVVTDRVPWFLTVLAVGIKLAWGTLETDVRMIEPFYILSRRHASPKVLTLDYTAMAFGWMPIRAFANRHLLVGLVGLGSVLAEVLTVCATSFANVSGHDFVTKNPQPPPAGDNELSNSIDAGEETFLSFWISFSLALGIITFLCLVATLVYYRRRHPFLPRQPNTIASVLAFIHQSKMLYDFVGTEKMNNDEMVERLGGLGKKYGLGWFTGRDGEIHCGVDEEELVSNYKHGDDVRKASQPWSTNWENY